MRQPIPSVLLSRRAKIALSVVAILIVLLILLVKFAGVYVNYLWFGSVGHRNIYATMFWTKVVLFFVFGALMALIIGGNLVVAYLIRPPFRPMSPEQQNLQNYALMIEPRRKLVLIGISLVAFVAAGAAAQGRWQQWQLFLHGGSFGQKDPQFHLDIGFYAFDYPAYRILLSFGFSAIIFALILTVAVHYLTGAIRLQTPGPKITIAARRQITALVFVFMALKAVAYWLDRYGLVFSDRSKFTGASYTDVHSELPAKTILFWITIVLAIGVLASIWLKSALLPGIGFIVLIILSIVIAGIYPAIVQRVSVKPNASDKEAPYIGRNIDATRDAYGIQTENAAGTTGSVKYVQYSATAKPAAGAVTTSNTTVDNIRILDPNVLGPTFTNFQKIAQPYGFSNKLNVDRYTDPQGAVHDYVVGVRQLEPANLGGNLNNWINQYTVYTHGYGFVAAQADQDVTNGDIPYSEGNIPPSGDLDLNTSTPQVYFGQGMNPYAIVGDKDRKREYDGNAGNNTYTGKGGVSLSSPLAKLAFATKYRETNFLLNDAVSAKGAKVILNRDPKALVQKIAPFLTLDGAPYPFVNQKTGHIMWMIDGYTTMANFPYSERQSLSKLTGTSLRPNQPDRQINYIRNSVKATVDAYDGTVKLYAWDKSDPILKAWRKIVPGLITDRDEMPADVLAHVRYPQDLFNTQRALLAQYHISNPVASYNGKGRWAVPEDPNAPGADQPAYYVLASPPAGSSTTASSGDAQFQLTSPMVVSNAPNLAAYITADSDPGPNYGKLTVLEVPGKSAVQGPSQVANVFKSEPVISRDISLLNSGQSTVTHGNLLTLPLGDSFLYVEPLYVQSTSQSSSTYPTLGRVLVTYGDKVGYGATLSAALTDIQKGRTPGFSVSNDASGSESSTPTSGGSSSSTPSSTPSSGTPSSGTTTAPTVASVQAQLNRAYAALASIPATDTVRAAAAQQKVNQLVKQLIGLGGLPTATPSASPSK
ncbi:UPF0182 family protein [uncultured Jatrophihabitans sp.]|uniref:UPF0182 family membrane protein n=1 Tax=uncultured Jatrophihabitans sp. TaxID=1610747 RepID=UPI0035CA6E0F